MKIFTLNIEMDIQTKEAAEVSIRPGQCYWYRFADLPARRVLVEWGCPVEFPDVFCCWDIDSGAVIVLSITDFVGPCEVLWSELARLGPEHRTPAQPGSEDEIGMQEGFSAGNEPDTRASQAYNGSDDDTEPGFGALLSATPFEVGNARF